ncbi:MAG: D-alanine--D-alanine ligase family protein [Patescibacteria group bacterium]
MSLLLIAGGRTGEHDVSVASANSIAAAVDRTKYDVIRILIDQAGVWRNSDGEIRHLLPVPGLRHLVDAHGERAEPIDVVFPIVHGTFGEDGCLQGLLELAELPYVGSGVLGSALGMDKELQKRVLRSAGLPVVDYVAFQAWEWLNDRAAILNRIEQDLTYPCFVKPVNLGSSVGISKVHNKTELIEGVELARKYDRKIIVEQAVVAAREIECAVLGGHEPKVSILGEIKPSHEFYDYEAKYESDRTELTIPADLPEETTIALRDLALQTFSALEANGLGRVDFLLDGQSNQAVVNEINTLPGFTAFSMYPKLWEASGICYAALIDDLVQLALTTADEKRGLCRVKTL